MKKNDVIVIGAGPVGIVSAMYLARRGYSVTVYEGRPDPRVVSPPRGRSINLTLSTRGWHALREVGAEDAVRRVGLPLTGRMVHQKDGSASRHLYGPNGEALTSIGRNVLARVLHEVAQRYSNIEVKFGHRLTHLDPESGRLSFEDSERGTRATVESERLLVADGASSAARAFLLGDSQGNYSQNYVPYHYKEIEIPCRQDGGWALDPESTHIWPRRDLLLCLFPNLDRSFTGSLFLPMHSMGDSWSFSKLTTLREVEGLFEQEFPDLLKANPILGYSFFSRPTSAICSIRCSPWTFRGKIALIGDAAHSVTPVLGQGLNCGLEDCSTLDACLDASSDWSEVLSRYESLRKPNADAVTQLAENHWNELSINAAEPMFVLRKRIENRLHAEYPNRIVPLYSLIAFTRIPYAETPKIAARQEGLVSALMKIDRVEDRWQSDVVQRLIGEYLAEAVVESASAHRHGPARTRQTLSGVSAW